MQAEKLRSTEKWREMWERKFLLRCGYRRKQGGQRKRDKDGNRKGEEWRMEGKGRGQVKEVRRGNGIRFTLMWRDEAGERRKEGNKGGGEGIKEGREGIKGEEGKGLKGMGR